MNSTEHNEPTAELHDYEPPELTVLGTLAEMTQLGDAPPDELLNDGSQA
jgi:hypothetical protein